VTVATSILTQVTLSIILRWSTIKAMPLLKGNLLHLSSKTHASKFKVYTIMMVSLRVCLWYESLFFTIHQSSDHRLRSAEANLPSFTTPGTSMHLENTAAIRTCDRTWFSDDLASASAWILTERNCGREPQCSNAAAL
jgi:hypothetical protein